MKTIFKYELRIVDEQQLPLPLGYNILSVGEQNGSLVLWAAVDSKERQPDRTHMIYVRGTGNPLDGNEGTFIGTVQMSNGLVWHVFSTGTVRV